MSRAAKLDEGTATSQLSSRPAVPKVGVRAARESDRVRHVLITSSAWNFGVAKLVDFQKFARGAIMEEPADPAVLLAFSLLQKWPASAHPRIWRHLIKHLLTLPNPDECLNNSRTSKNTYEQR